MEKNKSNNVILIIFGVLIFLELVFGIITMTEESLLFGIIKLIPLVFVALYGFWLYKKPHGNMLKCAIILTASVEILIAIAGIKEYGNQYNIECYIETIRIFASVILVYVAGRLNRIEKNKYLLLIAFAIIFVRDLVAAIIASPLFSPLYLFTWFSGAISILTLMIAYFARYKEHKEAGLMDKA